MAYSYSDFGAKSPGDTITVGFPFRSRDHVSIEVDGVPVSGSTWSWVNDGLVECVSAFPSGGRIKRTTPDDELEGTLVGTAVLDYPTINSNNEHLLFVLQEKADQEADREARLVVLEEDLEDQQGNLDATAELSRKWAEEAENVAVTPGHYSSLHHAAKSQQSATASSNSASTASSMATNSATARTGSETARDLSQKWASESEDVVVSGGLYSALHYAAKAAASLLSITNGLAGWIHAATLKATPVDADEFGFWDSVSGTLRKLSFSNLKGALKVSPFVPNGPPIIDVVTSLDTITEAGWSGLVQSSHPESPTSGLAYMLVLRNSAGSRISQLLIPYSSASQGIWFRTYTGTWSAWDMMALDSAVVKKAGSTMTGKLTLDGNPSSNLHAAPKQYIDGLALGVGQTWQTPTRVAGTTYQNTTGRPIALSIRMVQGAARDLEVSTDGTTWAKVMTSGGAEALSCFAVIPNNYYYRVLTAVGAWMELR